MSLPSVFISYNPNSEVEQTLALRLHTIGKVHGFDMILPDRTINSNVVSFETKGRILFCDYFIVFSTESLSHVVMEEINIAFSKHHDKSKILVVYDKFRGKNLSGVEKCTTVYINTGENVFKNVNEIAVKLKAVTPQKEDGFLSALGGILLVGLGLFALNEVLVEPPKARKRSPITKKKKRAHA